jgi:hypothetical protein
VHELVDSLRTTQRTSRSTWDVADWRSKEL